MTPFEDVVASKLIEQGYDVLTSGWPNFCAVKRDGAVTVVRFIEVKGRGDALRVSQQKLHKILHILGFEVEVIQEDANHRMQYPPDLSSGVRVVKKAVTGRPATARHRAILFLESELKLGPKRFCELLKRAADLKISRATLYRTHDAMQIIRRIADGEIFWELPEPKCN